MQILVRFTILGMDSVRNSIVLWSLHKLSLTNFGVNNDIFGYILLP